MTLRPLIAFLLGALLLLVACSHGERRLSEEERLRLGLTGIAYDLPLCPTEYDPRVKDSVVKGPCELVSCENVGGKIVCVAKPQPEEKKKRGR